MERIDLAGLKVDGELAAFVAEEALPGTGVTPERFWEGLAAILRDLAPRNRELLARRDDLHALGDEGRREDGGRRSAVPGQVVGFCRYLFRLKPTIPTDLPMPWRCCGVAAAGSC